QEEKDLAEDLIFNRRPDALQRYIEYFEKVTPSSESTLVDPTEGMTVEQRLHWKIVHRKKDGVEADIDEIINRGASSSPNGRGQSEGEIEGREKVFSPNPPIPDALLERVRQLRQNATDAEKLLWQLLRNRGVHDAKFRRQHPIASYILDFYCHQAK